VASPLDWQTACFRLPSWVTETSHPLVVRLIPGVFIGGVW